MPGIKIARGTDPFKKYWWVLLLAFGAVGGWVCLPALDGAGGGSAVPTQESGLKTADQSLDSAENPAGAPGSALDMPGVHTRAADGSTMASSLYQAPDDASVAASTAIVTPGSTFADALRDITRASAAKATVAASAGKGGWGEAAQRGFTAPKANFGAMSGFGGGSGSAASASSGGAAGGGAVSGFGGKGPNTGVSFAKGLKDDGSAAAPGAPNVAMRSLENAKLASVNAAGAASNDVARAAGGASFDGGGGGGRIAGGGAAEGATGGVYGKLDAAPANLKQNDPKLNQSKITPPPKPVPVPPQQNMMQQMMMQMIMSIAMAGIMAIL
jgi:hypothetical protein